MEQLGIIGHETEKVDLIIMGGTFTSRERSIPGRVRQALLRRTERRGRPETLTEAQARNETVRTPVHRDDRGDQAGPLHERDMRQRAPPGHDPGRVRGADPGRCHTLLVNRGHGIQAVSDATRTAKDAGIKVCYHVMPGLPGSSMEKDLESFRTMFDDERFRPDMVKIYPTLVVKGTKLYDHWLVGEYRPLGTEEATETIAEMLRLVPRWARVQRIQRDIPVPLIEAGVDKGHLRELAESRLKEKGINCQCIRCREVGLKGISEFARSEVELVTESYRSSGGTEDFISLELPAQDGLVGFARLRRGEGPDAMVRELKVFGLMAKIGQDGNVQHRGFGKELLAEAERRADRCGYDSLRVTSGVGVRGYYGSLGYVRDGPYMTKRL